MPDEHPDKMMKFSLWLDQRFNGIRGLDRNITTTILMLLLPVATLLGFVFAWHQHYEGLTFELLILWILTAIICFVRGLFIHHYNRGLAWCCFGVAVLPLPVLVVPLMFLLIWL